MCWFLNIEYFLEFGRSSTDGRTYCFVPEFLTISTGSNDVSFVFQATSCFKRFQTEQVLRDVILCRCVIGSRRFEEKKSKKTVEDKALQSFETSESTQSATQMHNLQSRILAYFYLYQ